MSKFISPSASWPNLIEQHRKVVPEAFGPEGNLFNLIGGEWCQPGHGKLFLSPVDATPLGRYPMIRLEAARTAVVAAEVEFHAWSKTDLDERKQKVSETLDDMEKHADLFAKTLVWEIGKPYGQSKVSVERCISGVRWYVGQIEKMMEGRKPLGLISNIASWNYPLSVLIHAVLVQCLAGNSVIAKTPTDGGIHSVTLAMALARRRGLPVSLVSGSGGELSDALVRNEAISCLAFVGGKNNGREIAAAFYDRSKRYMLEMDGVNCYGVWEYSDWKNLAAQIKKGFEFGKQRCTAYPRYVVQRSLFPKFLEMYLGVVQGLKCGHPLLVDKAEDALPALDFGPLINSKKVEELRVQVGEAVAGGAVALYEGRLDEARFQPSQDISAYLAPVALLNLPRNCKLYHGEPFGPVDSVTVVDSVDQMVAEMNVSNGNLVSSLATDDAGLAKQVAMDLRCFKFGHNRVRSRGDNEESFGGFGQSWKGCFVGGKYLVESVTEGPVGEKVRGNFPDYILLPEER